MQRNYEINSNKRELEDGLEQEKKRRVSVNLTEKHFELLDALKGSRSESLRRIIDWFRQKH